MSDDAASSSAAAASLSTTRQRDHPVEDDEGRLQAAAAVPMAAQMAERRKKDRQLFNKKRGELLDGLQRELDIYVYAQLSIIYYMDCSFARFMMRALVQLIYLTPKPAVFPEPSANRPFIGSVLGTNLLCLVLHAVLSAPAAGEETRGYLHGGVMMDFIGQKGPTNKWLLLALDLLVALLQIWQLAVQLQRQKLKEPAGPVAVATASVDAASSTSPRTSQDLDHEERGVRRLDIEMQALNPNRMANSQNGTAEGDGSSEEREALLTFTPPPRTDAHIFDAFHSGRVVLVDLDLVKTIKDQFWAYRHTPLRDAAPSSRELRANITGQLLRWRFGASVGRPATTRMG